MQIGRRAPEFSSPDGGNVGGSCKRSHAKLSWWSPRRGGLAAQLVVVVEAAALVTQPTPGAFGMLVLYGVLVIV